MITLLAFLVWMFLLFCGWGFLRLLGRSTDFWAMTEALSTALAVATVIIAGFFAYRELDEAGRSRHLVVADRLFDELNSPQNVNARRWVIENLTQSPETGVQTLSEEGREAVKRVLNSLDRIAFLTQDDWIPDDLVLPWMNLMVIKVWRPLQFYAKHERERRNEPDYYVAIDGLAAKCEAWRQRNYPDVEYQMVDHAL